MFFYTILQNIGKKKALKTVAINFNYELLKHIISITIETNFSIELFELVFLIIFSYFDTIIRSVQTVLPEGRSQIQVFKENRYCDRPSKGFKLKIS